MIVLIVDDDPFVLKLLSIQLRNFNLKQLGISDLVCCNTGADALTELERGDRVVGLVLCDLQMPDMDGVELVRHLVRLGYSGGLVLISGEDKRILQSAERLARAHRLNVLGALNKPVTPELLQRMLDNLLRKFERPHRARSKRYTSTELQLAIAEGQLINHYQPKVDFARASLVGVETLVRWQHPEDGLVYPDQFIGLAESACLIDALTREVLSNALIHASDWRKAGLDLSLAVNVSMANLADLAFPDYVAGEAAAAGFPLNRLVLEVTESQLTHDLRAALDILTRLRLKQIGLSIDDFGTGYSSLAQLRDLPFTELKIDRGFVHGASHNAAQSAILEASLQLARQLDIDTVSEGVEDFEDWAFVRGCGCDLAQGYFIAKPMPAIELVAWAATWDARRQELLALPA